MSEWIKCSERYPENDGEYLVKCGPYYAVAWFNFKTWECGEAIRCSYDMGECYLDYEVTHWMPLPAPPEVNDE